MPTIKKEIITAIEPILIEHTVFSLVFGSFSKGTHTEKSDFDLAVFLKNPPGNWEDKQTFRQLFDHIPGYDFDIIFLNDCDLIIAMQVLANGQVLVNRDPSAFIKYKAGIISRYIDFKMSRKIVEDSLVEG